MKKIRVGAVSYLNTKPLLYGLAHHPVKAEIDLVVDYPARIAEQLIDRRIDVGLIPVAATLKLPGWRIVGDYGIGSDGEVASVCLFSQAPMNRIERVLLDYQSRTSVNLAKILLKEHWRKGVEFVDATGEDFRNQIEGATAGVVIGDRALQQRSQSSYIFDLGEAWKAHTGLPFVFAAWITTQQLPAEFEERFNEANALGVQHIDEVVKENPFADYDLKNYFTRCIQYRLSEHQLEGMRLFLQKLRTAQLQPEPAFR